MGWALEVPWLLLLLSERARRFSTEAYVENKQRCALVKGVLNSLTWGLCSLYFINDVYLS